jgi:lipopolysaccharide/colanic/teichoic acid biosynthesis glycosyltransferase
MAGNQIRPPGEQTGLIIWQRGLKTVAYLGAAAGLSILVYLVSQAAAGLPVLSGSQLAVLAALYLLLALAVERSLAGTGLRSIWRYRAAFLLPACLAVSLPLSYGLARVLGGLHPDSLPGSFSWEQVAILIGGALFGALLSTWLREGLWENNSQPNPRIQAEVILKHCAIIGAPETQPRSKRGFDLCLAGLGLILSLPVWLACVLLLWLEDPGPLLFVKNSVGKGGRNFHQFKFRTMVQGAEDQTGPVLCQEGDNRVLTVGKVLRKTALDELPQLLNILLGEMSFVGPRPQRTVLVHQYLEGLPEYAKRHRVLPGLAGLAQVAGDYYLTPRQKLRFDRLYIRNSSLAFDLKLLWLAFLLTFWYRWQKGWNGRLPRRLFRLGRSYR